MLIMHSYMRAACCACVWIQILGAMAMPVNYSTDLRWRAVWLVTLRGMKYEEVSKMLFISDRSVRRYVDLFSTGDPEEQNMGQNAC